MSDASDRYAAMFQLLELCRNDPNPEYALYKMAEYAANELANFEGNEMRKLIMMRKMTSLTLQLERDMCEVRRDSTPSD